MPRIKSIAALGAVFSTLSTGAFAHHPMAGKTPSTFMEGLLSGIGHPVLGPDHLAFVVAMGVAAVLVGSRFLAPLAFIAATIAGTLLHLIAFDLPVVELGIALSLVAMGAVVFMGRQVSLAVLAALFALAGLFHGFAYGEAVYGAETTPILAYLAGFGVTQYAIAVLAGSAIVLGLGKAQEWASNVPARVAGGMVAGAGMFIMSEQAIAAMFG